MIDQPIQFVSSNQNIVFGETKPKQANRFHPPAGCPSGSVRNLAEAEQLIAYAASTLSQLDALTDGIVETIHTAQNSLEDDRAQIGSKQIQIDSYVQAIELAVASAKVSLSGAESTGLFSGFYDISHTANAVSHVLGCQVFRADLGATGDKAIIVEVSEQATRPEITLGSQVFENGLSADLAFELIGVAGAETFAYQQGTSAAHIVAMANLLSDRTGVEARLDASGDIVFSGSEVGSQSFVEVSTISEPAQGRFTQCLSADRAVGTDVEGTINGVPAVGAGHRLSLHTAHLNLALTLAPAANGTFEFKITGGGLQLTIDALRARIGLPSLMPSKLGGPSGRIYELTGGQAKSLRSDPVGALQVAIEARNLVLELQEQLTSFHDDMLSELQRPQSACLSGAGLQGQMNLSQSAASSGITSPAATHLHTFQPHVRGNVTARATSNTLPSYAQSSGSVEATPKPLPTRRTIVPQTSEAEKLKKRPRYQTQRIVVQPGPSVLAFDDTSNEEIFLRR